MSDQIDASHKIRMANQSYAGRSIADALGTRDIQENRRLQEKDRKLTEIKVEKVSNNSNNKKT